MAQQINTGPEDPDSVSLFSKSQMPYPGCFKNFLSQGIFRIGRYHLRGPTSPRSYLSEAKQIKSLAQAGKILSENQKHQL